MRLPLCSSVDTLRQWYQFEISSYLHWDWHTCYQLALKRPGVCGPGLASEVQHTIIHCAMAHDRWNKSNQVSQGLHQFHERSYQIAYCLFSCMHCSSRKCMTAWPQIKPNPIFNVDSGSQCDVIAIRPKAWFPVTWSWLCIWFSTGVQWLQVLENYNNMICRESKYWDMRSTTYELSIQTRSWPFTSGNRAWICSLVGFESASF